MILNINNLWYVHRELLLKLINDNFYIKWWGYYERKYNEEIVDWDADIVYKNSKLICKFISRLSSNYNFDIIIELD